MISVNPNFMHVVGLLILFSFSTAFAQNSKVVEPQMILLDGGTFTMGNTGERTPCGFECPAHEVTLRPFWVGKTEVTIRQWLEFARDSSFNLSVNHDEDFDDESLPITGITAWEIRQYAVWLKSTTGKPYRLLTEAEWEYSAAGGSTDLYSTGNCITTNDANFNGKKKMGYGVDYLWDECPEGIFLNKLMPVASYPPNDYGLYDMHGNAWEMVEDCLYFDSDSAMSYVNSPADGSPILPTTEDLKNWAGCEYQGLRGGSYLSWLYNMRITYRAGLSSLRSNEIGFRIAMDAE